MKIIINNSIYDISTFINEHPGGADVFHHESKIEGPRATTTLLTIPKNSMRLVIPNML